MNAQVSRANVPGHASIAGAVALARDTLGAAGFAPDDAALDAEVLARHVLGWDRARLIADGRREATPEFTTSYRELIERRLRREPVAMITGHREFWGLDFLVTPATLVPRPDTEIVVEEALRLLPADRAATILDVGTGTGCLAVALAHERPAARAVATDISPAALRVARSNANRHGVANRVRLVCTDLTAALSLRADLIVSNPPYVPEASADSLPADVIRYEPAAALFAGRDGLDVIRRLFAQASRCLAPGGRFIVEFGFAQDDAVRRIALGAGWRIERVVQDLQQIPRTIVLSAG